MLKLFIARLLIITQIYGNAFQGMAHAADLADSYEIRNEIHLRSFMTEDGGMRLALGTNRNNNSDHDSNDPEILDIIDIPKFEQLINPDKELKLETGLHSITEVDEDNLSEYSNSGLSTDDEDRFEFNGITRTSKAAYLTLQGLKIYISNTGAMRVEGRQNLDQENHRKPIFLSSVAAISLDGVTANALKLNAPQLINSKTSVIDCLRLGKLNQEDEAGLQDFTNYGTLNARELFLNNLNSDNQGTIVASHVGVHGEVEYAGQIKTDKLVLSEAAFLKLGEDSRADIKTLFLSKASHLQNQQRDKAEINIGVLDSLGGSVTNSGALMITEIAANSAFQLITNRHFMGIAQGDVNVETFTNSGAFGLNQGLLQVRNGSNSGVLKANGLEVADEFTNDKTGIITTSLVSGAGELVNLGKIETAENLALDGQKFTNSAGGLVKAKIITGLTNLAKFTNAEDSSIDAGQALVFADNTKVINQGDIKAHDLTMVGKQTTQEGEIRVSNLEITGGGEFENLGDIEVEQGLNLELNSFINKRNLSTKVLNGHQKLRILSNYAKASFKVRDGPLDLAETTLLGNLGIIEAKSLSLHTGKTTLYQSGTLKAANITLTGDNPFTNSGSIIATQKLNLNLTNFTNQKRIETPLIDISKITELTNAKGAVIDTQGSNLTFNKAKVVNDGTFKAGDLAFKGGSLAQGGRVDGKSLKLEDTVVTTTDTQTINLSGDIEQSGVSSWIMRGKFNARKFFKIGDINLYGTLSLVDSFRGAGTIHQTGKLITKRASFYSNVTLDGDLEVDALEFDKPASKFNLNGKALIKQNAKIGRLKVGENGKLHGYQNSSLSLSLAEEAEIAGLVDVDVLTAAKQITLSQKGILVSRKTTELQASLDIAQESGAELHDLKIESFNAITNNGKLKLVGLGKSSFTLTNNGQAQIEAVEKTWSSADAPSPEAINILLTNATTGYLTLKKGEFDLSNSNGSKNISQNAGTLVNESSMFWFRKFKNTGVWTSPGGSCLRNYNGQDLGDFRVDGELSVKSLVDGMKVLDGLKQTQAQKVILYADKIDNAPTPSKPINKTYPWPLEMRIKGDVNNSFEIFAPELSIYSRNFKTSADISALKGELLLDVIDAVEINARIGGKSAARIYAKRLKVLGKANKPGAAVPEVLYQRNGNGVYSDGQVSLEVRELINNHYGVIQGAAYNITAPQLINCAGLIVANNPDLNSKIKVQEFRNVRDEQGTDHLPCTGHDEYWHIRYHRGKCPDRPINVETSDEGYICSKGALELTYNYLEMLVSRITCGANLTFTAAGKTLVYKDGLITLPGVTKMISRNNRASHVVALKDIEADFGNGDIASSFYGANILFNAEVLKLQSLGVQPAQSNQVINLSNKTVRSLTFDELIGMPKTMVAIGQNVDQNQRITIKDINTVQRVFEENYYDLYRGLEGLGQNPEQFFKAAFHQFNEHVRGLEGTESHMCDVTSGNQTNQQIEILTNKKFTEQNKMDLKKVAVFIEMVAQNFNSYEDGQKANRDIENASVYCVFPKGSNEESGVNSKDKVVINTKHDLDIFTNVGGIDVSLVSEDGTVTAGSAVIRYQLSGWGNDHWEELVSTNIEAVNKLLIEGNNIHFKAVNTKSGKETRFLSKGNIVDEAVGLSSQTTSYHKNGYNRHKSLHQEVSSHSSKGEITSSADGAQNLFAPNFNCKKLVIEGFEKVNIYEVHDIDTYESLHETDGSFLGGTTTTQTNDQYSRSKGANFNIVDSVDIFSFGDINITNTNLLTPLTTLESVGGVVKILLGTNSESHASSTTSESIFWQSIDLKGSNHNTFTIPQMPGEVVINSKQDAILQKVYGQTLDYAKRIKIDGGKIVFEDVHERHQYYHVEHDGPTAAFAAVVAIAISLATSGAGTELGAMVATSATATMGATAATVLGLMTTGAFMGVCSQAGMALLQSKGDIGKAAKDLASTDSLKKIAKSVALAGLTGNGVTEISLESLCFKVVQNTVDAGLSTAILKEDFGKGFVQGIGRAGISNLTGYVAEKIGDVHTLEARNLQGTNDFTQISSHIVLGGVGGGLTNALIGGDIKSGIESGAIGAGIGTITTKILSSDSDTAKQRETKTKVADFTATVATFALKKDPNIAYQASNNANVHNDLKHMGTLKALGIVKEGDEVCEGEEGPTSKKSKKTEKQQDDERHRAKHKAELFKFFSKSLSPVRHDTLLQTEVAKPVKTFISSNVPDTFKELAHKTGESLGKKAEKSANAWQKFKQKPCEKNWSAKHAIRHGAFETLGALGTGVEYVKAYGRRSLRRMGMDANTAQDTMSVLDGLTMLAGGTRAVTSLGTLSKQTLVSGTKLTKKLSEMTKGSGPRIKAYVKDQFNYREFFEAERLRLEGGVLNLPKAGKYFDAEDMLRPKGCNIFDKESFMQHPLMKGKIGPDRQIGGGQLGSISEHQSFKQIVSKQVSQSVNKNKVVQKPEVGDSGVINPLLPSEGKVGKYKDLLLKGHRGDNLTPNHMPQSAFMEKHGVKKSDGISMMMEQPVPGKGGRHRQTDTYGKKPALSSNPRQELAKDLSDVKNIYKKDGVYTAEIKKSLLEVAEQNKQTFPELFKKVTE